MVQINADFNKKTIIQADELEWKPSRYPGVCRRYGAAPRICCKFVQLSVLSLQYRFCETISACVDLI